MVQAGAGTGKTHALVTQYLHLCLGLTAHEESIAPRDLVVLTFTEKAATELKERIQTRMQNLVQAIEANSEAVQEVEPDVVHAARILGKTLQKTAALQNGLDSLDRAPVGTFHSFAAQLLRRYGMQLGIDPSFRLLDEDTANDMQRQSMRGVLLQALAHTSTKNIENLIAQYGFVGTADYPALLEGMIQVVNACREAGGNFEHFSTQYQTEIWQSIWQRTRQELEKNLQALQALGSQLGAGSKKILESLDVSRVVEALPELVGKWLSGLCEELGRLRAQKNADAQQALAHIKSNLKDALLYTKAFVATQQIAPLAEAMQVLCMQADQAYRDAKKQANVLDFTDLLLLARNALRDHAGIRQELQSRYSVFLVDEFQDTNPLQADFLSYLVWGISYRQVVTTQALAENQVSPTKGGHLYLVGDRKQSIYQFRGADVGGFLRLCEAMVQAGGLEETLQDSRRSVPELIGFSNALFSQVFSKNKENASMPWQVQWQTDLDSLSPLRVPTNAPAAELLCAAQKPTNSVAESEAKLMAQHIRQQTDQGRSYADIVVLLRRFTHVERYVAGLKEAGIPAVVVGGRGFYQSAEILDLTAALSLIWEPHNMVFLLTVLRSPLCGLQDTSLLQLAQAGALSLDMGIEIPNLFDGENQRLQQLKEVLASLQEQRFVLDAAACLHTLIHELDLDVVLAQLPDGAQRVANLYQLIEHAHQFADQGGLTLDFIHLLQRRTQGPAERFAQDAPAPILGEQDNVVRIMTIHQAKGLEFPVVFIAGCAGRDPNWQPFIDYDPELGLALCLRDQEQGRIHGFPSLQLATWRKQRNHAESLRLFYVAVTRAKDQVVFVGEGNATQGSWRNHLDDFLQSADASLLRKIVI